MNRAIWSLGFGLAMSASACNGNDASVVDNAGGSGGSAATGGAVYGGGAQTGGASSANTTSALAGGTGGVNNAGGSSTAGGTTAIGSTAGGKSNTGGSATTSTGGAHTGGTSSTATGGSKPTGGASSSSPAGGSSGTIGGASTATGGMSSTASGGVATGGSATGGAGVGGQTTTPASATARFPFPQNRRDTNCVYPTLADYGAVQRVYDQWKKDLVVTDQNDPDSGTCTGCARVRRVAEPGLQKNSTVSEGIGYGMIIAVYMNDQSTFDGFFKYEQAHLATATSGFSSTQTSLMNWYIYANGKTSDGTAASGDPTGNGFATDADEDMVWGLIMADKQWGGKGSLSDTYLNFAKKLLGDIWKYDITNYKTPNNGNWGGDNCLNISYFAPSHYRVFATVSGESRWSSAVVPQVYSVIAASLNASNGNQTNGLVPGFSTSTGGQDQCGTKGESTQKHWYQYDACRTPFRIGLDACLNASTDAASYVAKTTSFFAPKGAAGINDGYELNGSTSQESDSYHGLSAAFIGTAGVGAMVPQSGQNYQSFIDDVYSHLIQNNMWIGGQYYDESWTLLSLLMMTGNYIDFTKY